MQIFEQLTSIILIIFYRIWYFVDFKIFYAYESIVLF